MAELKSITYEESRAEHFKALMKKMERKIAYWQYRGQYSLKPGGELSRANVECSEAGMQYNFYKDALEALAAQPKWISVEERLPEDDQDVLVHISGGTINTAFCTFDNAGYRHWTAYAAMSNNVTHWMPLPEPPKGEG